MLQKMSVNPSDARVMPEDELARPAFTATTVKLASQEIKSVGLGAYSTNESIPRFKLSCRPNIGGLLHVTLDRLDIAGTSKYVPMYQLRNLSDKSCKVTIKRH